jgi:hypothetical protein
MVISGTVRPADTIIRRANQFNSRPEAGKEYIEVDLELTCNRDADDKCSIFASSLKAVGADGNIIDPEIFISGIDELLDSGEFFGGSTKIGKTFYIVPKDDTSVVLFYDPFLGNDIYFALTETEQP